MKTLIWCITLCTSAASLALDVADVNQTLSFEMSEEQYRWREDGPVGDASPSPMFAVGVPIVPEKADSRNYFVPMWNSPDVEHFRSIVRAQDVSERQKAFVERRNAGLTVNERSSSRKQVLLAVSVEDAKKMAQAYLEYATERYGRWRASVEEDIEGLRGTLARYEAQVPVLIAEANGLQAELDALKKFIPYHSDEETLNAVAALNAMLNTISVEMSGIRSKIGAIQSYQGKRFRAKSSILLEDMLVVESIALKGAQARQETATGLRDQARRYVTLKNSLPELRVRTKDTKRDISRSKSRIATLERKLSQAIPPHIIDNVATIYPIRNESIERKVTEVEKD